MRYRRLLFCSLSGARRFAVAKRNRRLRRRFSRGCATTNAIVLMTLLSKCPRTFSKQYHKYRRSPRGRRSPCTPSKMISADKLVHHLNHFPQKSLWRNIILSFNKKCISIIILGTEPLDLQKVEMKTPRNCKTVEFLGAFSPIFYFSATITEYFPTGFPSEQIAYNSSSSIYSIMRSEQLSSAILPSKRKLAPFVFTRTGYPFSPGSQ